MSTNTQIEKEKEVVKYSKTEQADYLTKIKEMEIARDDRDQSHIEFDNMDYITYYDTNRKADLAFLPPKKNKQDTRMTSGITHEKDNSILAALQNFNFEADIKAFDENQVLIDKIGQNMEEMVFKSRTIEDYDAKRILIYRELISQGTAFVENLWVEKFGVTKKMKKSFTDFDKVPAKGRMWEERLEKVFEGSVYNLLCGKNVYLGNIREFFIHKQPYVFTRDVITYKEAESIYQNWEVWKNVPKKITPFKVLNNTEGTSISGDWVLKNDKRKDIVEVIKYQNKDTNEFQIFLNGVMMLPIGFPLEAISPSGEYFIAKGDLEPMPFFAYSKSIPAKTKIDDSIYTRFLQLMILKQQKSIIPPTGNSSSKVLSSEIHMPAMIVKGIKEGDVFPIGDNPGISNSDVSMLNIIREMIDNKSIQKNFGGEEQSGDKTARQFLEEKKQQVVKFGLVIAGVMGLERQMTWLRIYDIVENWTKAQDERVDDTKTFIQQEYKKITVDSTFEDGTSGEKIIDFNDSTMSEQEIFTKEKELSKERGKEVRLTFLNRDMLKTMKMIWYVEIMATEKENDQLEQALHKEKVKDAIEIFGPQALAQDKIKKKWAQKGGDNFEDWFLDTNQINQQQKQEANQQQGQGQPSRTRQEVNKVLSPSINNLAGA